MDEADRAQAAIETLEAHRDPHKPAQTLEPRGTCYYCDAPLIPGRRFCDAECRYSYDYEESRRIVNGSVLQRD